MATIRARRFTARLPLIWLARSGIVLLLVAALSGCAVFREPMPTEAPTPTAELTADQVARAMEEDSFFSDYRNAALLVRGTVASVRIEKGETLVTLTTSLPTEVVCDLGKVTTTAAAGDSIAVGANSSDVSRQDTAVLLRPCTLR